MKREFAVVDLFAGPGGLAEGFSSVVSGRKYKPFKIALSIEKETPAHATLLLRSFLRQFEKSLPHEYYDFLNKDTAEPDWAAIYPVEWAAANREALKMTLGDRDAEVMLHAKIDAIRVNHGDDTIVIGGPPCQAYSLVGRARNRGKHDYVAEDDPKHYLYRHYIEILGRLRPAAFVMENVKGMLSSSVDGAPIFGRVLDDLRNAAGRSSYTLLALSPRRQTTKEPSPSDFVLRSEDFGVPQARHRVIVVGLRSDIADRIGERTLHEAGLVPHPHRVRVCDVLDGMPTLRSGLSRGQDSLHAWSLAVKVAAEAVMSSSSVFPEAVRLGFRDTLLAVANQAVLELLTERKAARPNGIGSYCPESLKSWLLDSRLDVVPNNETRGHMPSDLARYLFAATFARVMGQSPKAGDFPELLAPAHRNWSTGKFSDRFRVQVAGAPSTTVTSHISKDGHYFIHPDPHQCRSLTVREAARLQTFPDNYYFKGNRTEQFIQVGNAVPPFLAKQIAEAVHSLLMAADANREFGQPRQASEPETVEPETVLECAATQ
jgi:DNA (cytosine-5)-methyltransferase 1